MLRHALNLSAVAFALHLVWEFWQCPRFFVHEGVPPTVAAMLWATLGDVGLTWVAQGLVAVATGRWEWSQRTWTTSAWGALLGSALVLSLAVEWRALTTGRWSYTEAAPLLPGTPISLLPVAQLLLLFPLTFALARALGRFGQPISVEKNNA